MINENARRAFARARAAEAAGDLNAARDAYDDVVAADPNAVGAWSTRGIFLMDVVGDHEAAAESFRRSVAVEPNYPDFYNLGNALLALGKMPEALQAFEESIGCNDQYAEAWVNRGIALFTMDRAEEARPSFERAIAVDPKLVNAYRCYSTVLDHLDEPQAAADASHKVAELLDTDGEAWVHFASKAGDILDSHVIDHEPGGRDQPLSDRRGTGGRGNAGRRMVRRSPCRCPGFGHGMISVCGG